MNISTAAIRVDGLLHDLIKDSCNTNLNTVLKLLLDKENNLEQVVKNIDVTCLNPYLCSEKDLKVLLELLVSEICTLKSLDQDCQQNSNCCQITEYTLDLLDRWDSVNTEVPKAYLSNGWVKLSGRIANGSTILPLIQMPLEVRPTEERRVPFAFTFSLPNVNNEHPHLAIRTNGLIEIIWSGSTPLTSLGGTISLDGIEYKL